MYSVDESPAEKAKHKRAVELLSVQPENLVVSTQVLQEFYVVTTRKLENPLSEERASGCERVLSEDLNASQVIRGVRIENPFT